MDTQNPTGYACAHCGRFAKFSAWLFAHWDEAVTHSCECGARSRLIQGRPVFHIPPVGYFLAAGAELDSYGRRYGLLRNRQEPDVEYRARLNFLISKGS